MGRRQWESIIATAARQSLQGTNPPVNVPVLAAGLSYSADLFAPPGSIGIVQSMLLDSGPAPSVAAGAISGNHYIAISTSALGGGIIQGTFNFDKSILFNRLQFNGFTSQEPNDYSAVVMALKGIYFDSVTALRLTYYNGSDKALPAFSINWKVTWLKVESA